VKLDGLCTIDDRSNNIDLTDFGIVKDHFGATGSAATWENGNCDGRPDIDGAYDVDLIDFGHHKANFGIDYIDW
jgi:hypothetical protein